MDGCGRPSPTFRNRTTCRSSGSRTGWRRSGNTSCGSSRASKSSRTLTISKRKIGNNAGPFPSFPPASWWGFFYGVAHVFESHYFQSHPHWVVHRCVCMGGETSTRTVCLPAGLYDFIFGFLPFRETFPPALNWPTNNNNNNKYYHKKTRKQKHKPPYPIIPSPSVPLRCVAPFVECVSASPISHFRFRRTTRGGDLKAMGENASERTRAPTVVCRIFGPNPMEDGFGGIFSNRCDCVENTLRNFRTPLCCQKKNKK